jgi:predicted metalloprotease
MRWIGQRESQNVEDRRGMRAGGRGVALGGGGIILLIAFSLLTGQDPIRLLETITGGDQVSVDSGQQQEGSRGAPADQLGKFASVVLGSTEDVWHQQFAAAGKTYENPTMVLFSGAVQSACGFSSAAVGPFYCPGDSKLYLDLSFFNELQNRFGAPGDFAQAYVIAHEIGHHVQNELGIASKVSAAQQRAGQEEANALSVRMELQADCLAGVWAHHANQSADLLEPGDVEEGLKAAAAIGDDQLQRQAQGYTVPESWTHGSSEMRVRWLKRGMQSGDINSCDTFGARDL